MAIAGSRIGGEMRIQLAASLFDAIGNMRHSFHTLQRAEVQVRTASVQCMP